MHDQKNVHEDITLENLDSQSFADKINSNENAVVIDVRTPMEYNEGHLYGSLLININDSSFTIEIEKLDKSKDYFIYCRSGNRSWHAGNYMLKRGFQSVAHLEPGIIGWDGPIEK
jgi:rhodanese-related sulfurtransferase